MKLLVAFAPLNCKWCDSNQICTCIRERRVRDRVIECSFFYGFNIIRKKATPKKMYKSKLQLYGDTCNLLNYCDCVGGCVGDCVNYFLYCNHNSECGA